MEKPPIKLYNTLTRRKEIFKPIKKGRVGMYACGPTVYDYDHIGHAWKYTIDDLLRRVLEYNGYSVKHVMNITDVGHLTSDADEGEDKIEKKAREEKKDAWEISRYYTKIFLENARKLNHLEPSVLCKATDHIPEMIALIQKIWDKGAAYKISDGIYFDVTKFPKYGQLSGNTLENLEAGSRIEVNPEKHHPADFALWKFSPKNRKRQMEWDSPWGKGFPGWHVECSAMSMKNLGNHFDIHTGGEDNIFPHHESEIAQSETATGEKFVNYWLHTRFLNIEGQKMSKSLGNFLRLQDLEARGFDPLAFRYLCLTAHRRSQLNFTWEGLKAAQTALERLRALVSFLRLAYFSEKIAQGELVSKVKGNAKKSNYERMFLEAVNDDLNLPRALAVVWEIAKEAEQSADRKGLARNYELILDFDKILGLRLDKIAPLEIPPEIDKLVEQREELRRKRKFDEADKIRDKMKKLGFTIEDKEDGPVVKRDISYILKQIYNT